MCKYFCRKMFNNFAMFKFCEQVVFFEQKIWWNQSLYYIISIYNYAGASDTTSYWRQRAVMGVWVAIVFFASKKVDELFGGFSVLIILYP